MATKAKRKIHRMPPLSVVDKLIYWVLLFLILALSFSFLFGTLIIRQRIAYSEEGVVAALDHASLLWFFPGFFCFFLATFIPWNYFYQGRKPIFGKRNFPYGPPAWPREYPLFMKNKPHFWGEEKKKKKNRRITLFLLVLVLINMLPLPLSFYGRDCLRQDGSIVVYNMFNKEISEYRAEDIVSVELDCRLYRSGRRGRRRMTVYMTITAEDGEDYRFRSGAFENAYKGEIQTWLTEMLRIKEAYDPRIITYSNTHKLGQVIEDRKLNDAETALLYELFDIMG